MHLFNIEWIIARKRLPQYSRTQYGAYEGNQAFFLRRKKQLEHWVFFLLFHLEKAKSNQIVSKDRNCCIFGSGELSSPLNTPTESLGLRVTEHLQADGIDHELAMQRKLKYCFLLFWRRFDSWNFNLASLKQSKTEPTRTASILDWFARDKHYKYLITISIDKGLGMHKL